MRQSRKIFISAFVKPFVEPTKTSTGKKANKDVSDIICFGNQRDTNDNLKTDDETITKEEEQCEGNKRCRKEFSTPFVESRASERKGLIENGTSRVISRDEVADGRRIFGSRFVDTIKCTNSGAQPKSRLVAQN